MYFPIQSLVDVLFLKFFKSEENLKKNTSTSGCIGKYISLVKMYKKYATERYMLKNTYSNTEMPTPTLCLVFFVP